ncbi:MAG: hypothetical protein P4M09_29020, partial [Devosia sp.]|nr:hypothetical protein [Devosia sp.]
SHRRAPGEQARRAPALEMAKGRPVTIGSLNRLRPSPEGYAFRCHRGGGQETWSNFAISLIAGNSQRPWAKLRRRCDPIRAIAEIEML